MVDQAGDCKKVFNFHLVISSALRRYRSIHSSYCCWLPTLGCIAWSSFHWIHWNANHIHQHVTYRVAIPQVLEQCGGFDGKNAPIGGAIALDICKAPHICPGFPSRRSRWHVNYKFWTVICWLYVCCYNYENKFFT